MDLNLSAEHEDFRADVAKFLADNWTPGTRDPEAIAAFRKLATNHGYLYRSVPRRYGGSEQAPDPVRARIIKEQFGKVRAPGEIGGPGPGMIVPTLLVRGEEWQREKFIEKTLTGEYVWCQGYSEPGSGSDLASLRTRAVLDDDQWVIDGQKVWTTDAHKADFMFILVRTDPATRRHEGITYLLVNMRQPGITVRPLRQMTGGAEFNEVFLEGARTPKDWIVGEVGQGWSVSKSTLKFERDNISSTATTEQQFRRLVELAQTTKRGGRANIDHEDVRQALAKLEGYILAQKYSSYRQMSMNLAGKDAGLIETLGKLNGTEIGLRIADLAMTLLGDEALVMPASKAAAGRDNAKWVNQIMGSIALTIAGGTSNIQRNLVAERALGLPREGKGS